MQTYPVDADEIPAPPERQFVKPTTLNGLLEALLMIDEAMLEIDLDQQVELMENGKVKVDNYKYLIDKMELQAAFLKKRELEYQKARRTMEGNAQRLENHMIYALRANKFEKFTGHEYEAKLRYSEFVELKFEQPGDHHAIFYGQFIKTTREWKKTELKNALKKDNCPPEVRELASIEKRAKVSFSVIKDI